MADPETIPIKCKNTLTAKHLACERRRISGLATAGNTSAFAGYKISVQITFNSSKNCAHFHAKIGNHTSIKGSSFQVLIKEQK